MKGVYMGYALLAIISGAAGGVFYQHAKARLFPPDKFRCKHGDLTFWTHDSTAGAGILGDHIQRFHPEDIRHVRFDLGREG